VVNLDTKRAIPHIHYVALSYYNWVTTIVGLYMLPTYAKTKFLLIRK
jgi:hypothetical protein